MKIYTYEGKANISGDRIHQARTAQRLSQDALAAKLQVAGLGIGREAISRIETGLRFVTDYELVIFARVLGVTIEWLTGDIYRSPVGILKIVRQPDGTFGLCHNETVWEACDTPQAEADNVFCHVTGCDEWDSCPDAGPSDLSEWEYIPS